MQHNLFTGEQYDPNAGFYYLRARWMNPETGRFLTVDPFEGVQNDPKTLHKYLYVSANPVMYVDPSGEMTLAQTTTVISIIGILGTSYYATHGSKSQELFGAVSAIVLNAVRNSIVLLQMEDIFLMSSKHNKEVIEGQLEHALIHANKLAGYSGGPDGPQKGWKTEIKAALERAKRIAKRLKGNTKEKYLKLIDEIASKAGVTLDS